MVFCGKLVENKGLRGIGWWVSGVDKGVDNVDKLRKKWCGGAQGNPQRWELRVGINVWIVWISWENCWRKGGWLTGREWESFKRRNCRIQNGKMTGSGLYV